MTQVIRFFHVRDPQRPRGGATVRVTGEDDGLSVRLQIAYCSPKDQFCRATGRKAAEEARIVIAIPLKGLPGALHKVSKGVLRKMHYNGMWRGSDIPKNWRQQHELWKRDWQFSMKYWLPKQPSEQQPEPMHISV